MPGRLLVGCQDGAEPGSVRRPQRGSFRKNTRTSPRQGEPEGFVSSWLTLGRNIRKPYSTEAMFKGIFSTAVPFVLREKEGTELGVIRVLATFTK